MLATENELTMARETVRRFEDRFNRHRRYPWVFLTHTKFSAQFKELTSALTGGDAFYGQIPRENWSQPSWVDYHSMVSRQQDLLERGINDAMNMTKRHMWRFHSGLLARHELLAPYDFFWRVEPGIHLYCDMEIDPMLEMQRTGKKFAWSLSLRENQLSTPSVWKVLQNFKTTYPTLIPAVNDEEFIRDRDKDDYNDCFYGVQNSIGSFEFFRSEAYRTFFDFVDKQGVIYYERWTDAIVMTLGLSLLLPRSEILFLDELAWAHGPFHHCPIDEAFNQQRCICNPASNVDDSVLSCTAMWHGREQKKSKKETVVCQKNGKCILYVDISGR
ncbi:alpha 1,2-mannosyltransferase 2.4.1 [Actinomortierella ambigua]|nr:alpha 1,2-mannosyltransferase 2.4.1 [Actinomortierella ambigua]